MKSIDPAIFADVHYSCNPMEGRNWELHNIGIPNRMQRLEIDLMHMEIKYLEEYLKINSSDLMARSCLDKLKNDFEQLAQHATVID